MKRCLAAATVTVLVLAGCARDENVAEGSATPTAEATATPAACSLEGGGAVDVKDVSPSDGPALLTEVRFNPEGCPRVAFVFENTVPPYEIGYKEPPFSDCGSGDPVDTSGWGSSAYIVFHSNSASGVDLSGPEFRQTYTGDKDIDVGSPILRRLRETCDFEATLEWIIALDAKRDFKLSTLDDPPRLVIDIDAS